MKRLILKLFHTITGRVVVHVTLFSIVAVLAIFAIFLHLERSKLLEGGGRYTMAEMESLSNHINEQLHEVETALDNNTWQVASNVDTPDSVYVGLQTILEENPIIYACSVAFVPDYYKDKGHYYSPCVVRQEDGSLVAKTLEESNYSYEFMNWYIVPVLTRAPFWGYPTNEYYGIRNSDGTKMITITYSRPLYDQNGDIYAVMVAEVDLDNITKVVRDVKIFPHSFNVLLDRKGMHIVHPDSSMVLHEAFLAEAYGKDYVPLKKLQEDVSGNRSGFVINRWNGEDYYVAYRNVQPADWTMLSICPIKDVMSGVERYALWASVIAIIFLFFVVVVCHMSVRFVLHPIEDVTQAIRRVARGKFDNNLVPYSRTDEIGRLRSAFIFMQKMLAIQKERMRREVSVEEQTEAGLRLADEIRQNVMKMTKALPSSVTSVDVSARIVPARMSAGDMFVYFVEDGLLYFLVMGVSTRGTLATATMSTACRIFRSEAARIGQPEPIANMLNRTLSLENDTCLFCPAFIGILNLNTAQLDYCNAGHPVPYILNAEGEVSELKTITNIPFGLSTSTEYACQSLTLQKGSLLCLYTDGVTDAVNAEYNLYGDERLKQMLRDNHDKSASSIVNKILANARAYIGEEEQIDDMTVMALRMN